ncbi:Uma2 family endonuclease [Pannus brasiliensis CCIBt3594]|uniref:Uma2 family endonuclease n=1 Tax=Pannus brasiliensis CCIBt3594 TaxID=1427578 RepID=A0AAW9QWQ7_9CHRO
MKTVAKWTVEEYHRLIEAGMLDRRRVELIAGEILEMAPESPFHAFVTEGSAKYIQNLLRGLALIREAHPIALDDSEPEPDLAIVRLPRQQYSTRHPGPEEIFWVIEVSRSTLEYDLTDKKRIYARAGIPEYWGIDIESKRVYLFRDPRGEDYESVSILDRGTILPLAFPDIPVAIEGFWTENENSP